MLRCAGGVEWLNAFYILRWMSWQILLTAYTQPHLKSSPAWSKEVKVAGHVFHFLFFRHQSFTGAKKHKRQTEIWLLEIPRKMYVLFVCVIIKLFFSCHVGQLSSQLMKRVIWLAGVYRFDSWAADVTVNRTWKQNCRPSPHRLMTEAGDLKWSDFVMAFRPHLLIRWKEEPLNEQLSGKYKLHIHIRDYGLFLDEHWTAADWIELNVKCRIKKRETSFSLIY